MKARAMSFVRVTPFSKTFTRECIHSFLKQAGGGEALWCFPSTSLLLLPLQQLTSNQVATTMYSLSTTRQCKTLTSL